MNLVSFNIHNYPKLKIAAEIDGEPFSQFIRKDGFRSIVYIADENRYNTDIFTHIMSEKEFFLFSIKWS